MTLGNMRSLGVRSLAIYCTRCHHQAVLPVEGFGDHVEVPSFGPKIVCTRCGSIGAEAWQNWREHQARGT